MKASTALVLLGLVVCCSAMREGDNASDVAKRKRGPWFCHGRDCPCFETVREEADYSVRCYERSTWAVSCAYDAYMPDGVFRATAKVLRYVKENDLWGATPLGHMVHLSLDNQEAWLAWNATATETEVAAAAAALPPSSANDDNWVHKLVCAGYYLPDKYQSAANSSNSSDSELDRHPPRPARKSGVRIFRAGRWEAFVSGFHGFPTPPRFIWESMRLMHALHWHQEDFDWRTSLFYVYDPPTAVEGRWNEVLIPARHSSWMHDLLLGKGEDVFADSSTGEAVE